MTKEEAKIIVYRICKLYYTQSRHMTDKDIANMLDTWAEEFKNDSYDDVSRAVSAYSKSGKPFMPNPPDIIQVLIDLEDTDANVLFNKLVKAAEMAANPVKHLIIDDLGGLRWSEEHQRQVYFPAEAHYTTEYTQTDFAALPKELQEYAESIYGLKRIHNEIESNRTYARQRFVDHLPALRRAINV